MSSPFIAATVMPRGLEQEAAPIPLLPSSIASLCSVVGLSLLISPGVCTVPSSLGSLSHLVSLGITVI